MHQLLNTLYVMTPRSYLHLDHETVKVKVQGELKLQVPLHEVYERWVRKFERQRLSLLHDLKKELEGE